MQQLIKTFFDDSPEAAVAALLDMSGSELTEDELGRFVDVLRTDFAKRRFREDDTVTLLWYEELQGIRIRAFNTFGE